MNKIYKTVPVGERLPEKKDIFYFVLNEKGEKTTSFLAGFETFPEFIPKADFWLEEIQTNQRDLDFLLHKDEIKEVLKLCKSQLEFLENPKFNKSTKMVLVHLNNLLYRFDLDDKKNDDIEFGKLP